MERAIFFDKDGVLNIDGGTSGNFSPTVLMPGATDTIAYLRNRGFKIFVATNQPVVARGLMSEDELIKYFVSFERLISENNAKALIDKIYYCPHHPNATVETYRMNCDCRKPRPGMLLKAAKEFNIDLEKSYMIGDRTSDIIAGSLAGCQTIQLLSGKHTEAPIETDLKLDKEINPEHFILKIDELRGIIK